MKAENFLNEMPGESSSDSDEQGNETNIHAVRYLQDEKFTFDDTNVYALTIAANFADADKVTWREYMFGMRLCIYCTVCQMMVAVSFGLEYLSFDGFAVDHWET